MNTPRTDEAGFVIVAGDAGETVVKIKFARNLERENAALRDKLSEREKDAERYRWLRINGRDLSDTWYPDQSEFEAAIDAAIAAVRMKG